MESKKKAIPVGVSLDKELLMAIDERVKILGLSRSAVISIATRRFLGLISEEDFAYTTKP